MSREFTVISKQLDRKAKEATIKVQDNYGNIETVTIAPCYESFQQWGAATEVLWFTLPIAERLVKTKFKKF
jgi:hypothetical protein